MGASQYMQKHNTYDTFDKCVNAFKYEAFPFQHILFQDTQYMYIFNAFLFLSLVSCPNDGQPSDNSIVAGAVHRAA